MQAFADPRPAFHYYLRTRPQLEIHHTRGGNIQAQELAMFLRSQIWVSSANGDLLYDIRAAAMGSASLSPRTSPIAAQHDRHTNWTKCPSLTAPLHQPCRVSALQTRIATEDPSQTPTGDS